MRTLRAPMRSRALMVSCFVALTNTWVSSSYGQPASALPSPPEQESVGTAAFEPRLWLTPRARATGGIDRRASIQIREAGFGADLRLTPELTLRGGLFGAFFRGESDEGPVAPWAVLGETGLVVSPFWHLPARPYLFSTVGLYLFPEAPFFPAGSHYDFRLSGGGGVAFAASDRIDLAVEAFTVHISNGQGLGEHNPSLDGYGAELKVSYALGPREPIRGAFADEDERKGSPMPAFATLDMAGGVADGEALWGPRLRLGAIVLERMVLAADLESGALAAEAYGEAGLGLAVHANLVTFAAHLGSIRYVGFNTAFGAAQIEGHLTPNVSILSMAFRSQSQLSGSATQAAAGVRVFPLESLRLDGAVGFRQIGSADASAEPILAIEWGYPLGVFQLGAFAETRVTEAKVVGVRLSAGAGKTPRERVRQRSWERLR